MTNLRTDPRDRVSPDYCFGSVAGSHSADFAETTPRFEKTDFCLDSTLEGRVVGVPAGLDVRNQVQHL